MVFPAPANETVVRSAKVNAGQSVPRASEINRADRRAQPGAACVPRASEINRATTKIGINKNVFPAPANKPSRQGFPVQRQCSRASG